MNILKILIHDGRSIYAFAAIKFGDSSGDLLTGVFDPGLMFGVEVSEEVKGDRKDFFGVGVTSGIEAASNEFSYLGVIISIDKIIGRMPLL
jgi:hypothetical protein